MDTTPTTDEARSRVTAWHFFADDGADALARGEAAQVRVVVERTSGHRDRGWWIRSWGERDVTLVATPPGEINAARTVAVPAGAADADIWRALAEWVRRSEPATERGTGA